MIDLQDRKVLITGGSRGIGRAAAILFARAGADVAINYFKNKQKAEEVTAEIRKLGRRGLAVQGNVASFDDARRNVDEVLQAFGRIDVLVNNAGIWEYGAIHEMTPEEWQRTLDINLNGVFYFTRLVVPHMMKQRSGRIIHISSTAGQRGEAFHSHYAATKGAIIAFTKSLAPELADYGILVNCVAPGWVNTDMSAEALVEERDTILRTIPLKRAGEPEEIAGAVLFLASDLATYITGEILNVNGGSVLCG
ncbi:MAG TPA: 3-oxoacyl-ACP reductase FabG [Bacteroidetes bacterium]|nr:3-oxoacyl-ACP reductase FabG [Bacteroidota bacterium]